MIHDVFGIAIALKRRFVRFLGSELSMSALNILTDHDQRHEQQLDDITDEQEKSKGIRVEGMLVDALLPHCPSSHEDGKEYDSPHCSYGASYYHSEAIKHRKSLSLNLIDISRCGAVTKSGKDPIHYSVYFISCVHAATVLIADICPEARLCDAFV